MKILGVSLKESERGVNIQRAETRESIGGDGNVFMMLIHERVSMP